MDTRSSAIAAWWLGFRLGLSRGITQVASPWPKTLFRSSARACLAHWDRREILFHGARRPSCSGSADCHDWLARNQARVKLESSFRTKGTDNQGTGFSGFVSRPDFACVCVLRRAHMWGRNPCWHLTARPTATGEKHRTSVNRLARPSVGANVRTHEYSDFGVDLCDLLPRRLRPVCTRVLSDQHAGWRKQEALWWSARCYVFSVRGHLPRSEHKSERSLSVFWRRFSCTRRCYCTTKVRVG